MKRINEETYQKIRTLIANLEGVKIKSLILLRLCLTFPVESQLTLHKTS